MSDAVSNWRACLNSRCRALLSLGILLAACVDFRARSARRSSNVPTCLARLRLLSMGYFPGPPSLIRRLVSCSVCPLVATGTRRLVNRLLPYKVGRGDARAPLQANLLFGAEVSRAPLGRQFWRPLRILFGRAPSRSQQSAFRRLSSQEAAHLHHRSSFCSAGSRLPPTLAAVMPVTKTIAAFARRSPPAGPCG